MGVVLYLILDRADTGIVPEVEGKALFVSLPLLDGLARKLGVREPQSFMDNRPAPAGVDIGAMPDVRKNPAGFGEWLEAVEKATAARELAEPWDEWFDASDGAVSMAALANEVASNEQLAADLEADVLHEELQKMARCLAEAHARGVRFRFEAW